MEKIIIWGTGCAAKDILNKIDIFTRCEVLGFVDNNVEKQGTVFFGKTILSPESIKNISFDKIVVMTYYFEEISKQIQSLFPEKNICVEDQHYFFRNVLLERYNESKDPEIIKLIEYIKSHNMQTFNYEFVNKYLDMDVEVAFDAECEMHYAIYKGKRMYLSKELDTYEKAEMYYRNMLLEQDIDSPHRYLSSDFDVEQGDIVLDVGVAEGNFSLEIVDRVKKIYMIETDEGWIDALKKTFEDYKDKIVIINRFATSFNQGKYTTLDSVIDESVNFIKMDIEGNEWDALQGAKRIISQSKNLKCAICSYHREYDEILIKDVLCEYGMKCSTTKGYMWFQGLPNDHSNTLTRFSRAIVRGEK